MSDSVMRRLTGWSPAQLAAWRASLRRPAALSRADRLRAALPAEFVDAVAARGATTDLGARRLAERELLSRLCDTATARALGREQGRLFTDADLDECIPERLKLPARKRSS